MSDLIHGRAATRASARLTSAPHGAIVLAMLFAAGIAALSSSRTYDERLIDLAARRTLPGDLYCAAAGAPELQALFLDAAGDREVAYKLRLAVDKYGERGRMVLDAYGTDPAFEAALRAHGENIIPVIAFFMENDLRSLKAVGFIKSLVGGKVSDLEAEYARSRPEARGRHAVQKIVDRGHHFLGQFSIDAKGVAHWNQIDRGVQALAEFVVSGLRDLEGKLDVGDRIGAADVASAGADMLVGFSAVKALKIFQSARAAGAARGTVSSFRVSAGSNLASRTRLLGAKVLGEGKVSRLVVDLGAPAVAAYLTVRHPSLLNSVFENVGSMLGLPAWLAKFIGWTVIALPFVLIAAPVLAAMGAFLSIVANLLRLGVWLRPRRARVS